MAQRVARRVIHNPGRMSDKQIKFFGTAAQKAALKRRRAGARKNAGRKRSGLFRRATSKRVHKARTRPRRVMHSNPGEILSLVANPAKRRKGKMAKQHRRRKRAASNPARRTRRRKASVSRPKHRRRTRGNPTRVVYRTRKHRAHRRRGNPSRAGGGGITGLFTNALWLIGGAVGTKVLTQAVLGAKNTGVMGYIGNAVAAFGLSLLVGKLLKNPTAGKAVLSGGIVALVLRLLSDYTPLGQYTSAIGMGDYQVSHWVTPQRYVDALNSAEVEIPQGWAPTVIQSNSAPGAGKGMASYGGPGNSMYTSGGLYST